MSADSTDAGYETWRLEASQGRTVVVFLDDVELREVETADEEAGFVIRACTDAEGHLVVKNGEIERETLHGRVRIEVR